ncbi:ABC transporter ATP-binding protein [Sphingobacteriales bacterium UPWRP_1]|nr:ABC transporter [Sphingobacteriales bacterium TSM_CSS]PSJ78756.1 ABC transporter ATP-binding protein [Sphingobacteriales bacterium UPWRP_1]
MNYLLAENLTKVYGVKVLFENLDFSINKGQKIALIARNGAGKSSLIRILVGLDSSDKDGTVRLQKGVKLGYIEQDPQLNENDTVLESVLHTENPVIAVIQRYENALLQHELHPSEQSQKMLELCIEAMQHHQAWDYDTKIKQILTRFKIANLHQPIREMSGGEKKRVAMAGVLIQEPDLLIMDEPTNHLDLEMIEWLEEYLRQTNLTLLLVTHDRYFLNNVTTEIVELENGTLQRYRGNYEYYLEKKAELQANMKTETEKAQKLMKKELEWLRTQPKARTTKAKSRIDAFDHIEEKAQQKTKEDELSFDGMSAARIGNRTIEMYHLYKRFGNQIILDDFTYVFKRRDRAGIVGKNGAGKTTFLNILAGLEKPDEGKILIGQTLVTGYYTQEGLQMKEDKRVIDVVRDVAEILPLKKGKYYTAAQLLDHFMLPYSMHQNYASTLSGGERRRLYLLTILMKNPNFLILDEPTNDLDLITLNLLEDYLLQFEGCLVIVSHDRYFMDKLVDHVFVFEGNGKTRDYPGNYSRYREAKAEEEQAEREKILAEKEKTAALPKPEKTDENTTANKAKTKLSFKEQREFDQLNKEIEQLEAEKEQLSQQLNLGSGSHDELMKWANRLSEVVQLLDTKTDRWLELSEFV